MRLAREFFEGGGRVYRLKQDGSDNWLLECREGGRTKTIQLTLDNNLEHFLVQLYEDLPPPENTDPDPYYRRRS